MTEHLFLNQKFTNVKFDISNIFNFTLEHTYILVKILTLKAQILSGV